MKEKIKEIFSKYSIEINDLQAEKFVKYYDFLIEENKKFNLTAITDFEQVILKHFIDSVLPINEIKHNAKIVDVGTGAGFPGIPIKILRDDVDILLVDSLEKRIKFLNELIKLLSLKKIKTLHSRAEDIGNNRETFDVSLSRAVAKVNTLSEYLIPYVKVGGKIIMYKGKNSEEELTEGENAINILGGELEDIKKYYLPEIESERNVIIIKKIKHTNKKYPRNKNLPKLKPL